MFEFVLIQPGTFMMGSPEDEVWRLADETLHEVTITKPFYMQTTPVTQKQWKAVMGNNPSYYKGNDLPVETVSWKDTQEFIHRLNQRGEGHYRLPTEAEWEYACRAGTSTPFGIGDGYALSSMQANICGTSPIIPNTPYLSRRETTPVKSFEANAWGLYDMHGNVWEWVQDWYGDYPSEAVSDPQGPDSRPDRNSRRVLRGGCWLCDAHEVRSALRYTISSAAHYIEFGLGFRLVKEV